MITINTPNGKSKMKLSYIVLVPTMFINIVVLSRATVNDIHFDSGWNLLYYLTTGKTVCYTKQLRGHWALMYRGPTNSLNLTKSIFSTFKRYQSITALNMITMLSPDLPTSAPDTPISAPVATTTTSPESPNVSQLAARVRTCWRCKKQFKSGNKLYKYLRESYRYT